MSQYWHPWVLRFEPASVRDRLSQVQETSQIRLGKNVRLMQKPWNSQVDLPDWHPKKKLVDAQTLELSWGDFLASQVPIKVLKLATWFLGCWEFQDSALQSFTRGKASALAVGKKIRPLETRAVIKFRECSGMHVCALASVHMYPNMFCRYIHLYVNSIWRFTSLYALVHIYLYIYIVGIYI